MKKKDFVDAPMFTVFTGPVELDGQELLGDDEWDLFDIDGLRTADATVRLAASRRGIRLAYSMQGMLMEPEKDDEFAPDGADDFDAALAYIAGGGRLVKLPDSMTSPYWRLYPVLLVNRSRLEDVDEDVDEETANVARIVDIKIGQDERGALFISARCGYCGEPITKASDFGLDCVNDCSKKRWEAGDGPKTRREILEALADRAGLKVPDD